MDPATLFLGYATAGLLLWLLATLVQPCLAIVCRIGSALPIGRRAAALVVSVLLVAGVARPPSAEAVTPPPSHRLIQVVDAAPMPVLTISRAITVASSSQYTVQRGDSLWRIAKTLLASSDADEGRTVPELWRRIYDMNRALIGDNPNLIHPGQVLEIPGM